jgi:glycosyltransferase involved in cell wall biosynthesis
MSASIACVVPAYNAAERVGSVVRGVRRALAGVLVVGIDDGSADATGEALGACCDAVVRHPRNLGKGSALRAGFALALARGAERVVTIDADGQHDPASAPLLVAALDDADVVLGSRSRRGSPMPVHRRLSNALSSACVSIAAGCPIPDSQTGYRAFRASALREVEALGDRYDFETDLLIRLARRGFRVATVPVPTIYGAASHFRPVRDTAHVIRAIWRHRAEVFR